MDLHSCSDALEQAYSIVVYLKIKCSDSSIQVAVVSLKTNIEPIKRLTIPHLEVYSAKLLYHVQYAWD